MVWRRLAIAAALSALSLLMSSGAASAASSASPKPCEEVVSRSTLTKIFKLPRVKLEPGSVGVRTATEGNVGCRFFVWKGPARITFREQERLTKTGKAVYLDLWYKDGQIAPGGSTKLREFTNRFAMGKEAFEPRTFGAELAHASVGPGHLINGAWCTSTTTGPSETAGVIDIELGGAQKVAGRARYEKVASFAVPALLRKLSSHQW